MSTVHPLVSILIPVYNMESFIEEAVDSALNQIYLNIEIVIVDNCSTDSTLEKLGKYKQYPNVFIYKNICNIGMVQNWNTCLLYAKGEYIKFLNADDLLMPDIVSEFTCILDKHPNVKLVTSFYKTFGTREEIFKTPIDKVIVSGKEVILSIIDTYNWVGCPTQVMFRKNELYQGSFSILSTWWADYELWFKLLLLGDLYIIHTSLSSNRFHEGQVTNDFVNGKSILASYKFNESLRRSDLFYFAYEKLDEKLKNLRYVLYTTGMDLLVNNNRQLAKPFFNDTNQHIFSISLISYISSRKTILLKKILNLNT